MVSWRDTLRAASFRNVAFHVDASTLSAGRRLARHEYPQRDTPYLEDMGRKAREYKIEALLIGADYMAQRDALLSAIEAAGPGQLVHPYYGTLQVVVAGDCQINESTQQGGMARISIPFIEAGTQQEPSSSTDTSAAIESQKLVCENTFAQDFAATFSVANKPDFVADDAQASVASVLSVPGMSLGNLAWIRADTSSALYALLPENLQASLRAPLALARGLLAQVSALDSSTASGGGSASYGSVSDLLSFSLPTVSAGGGSAARQALGTNREALGALMLQAATMRRIVALSSVDAITQATTVDDVRAATREIVQRADRVLFSPSTGQASADALVQLRTLAVAQLNAIAPKLARIVTTVPLQVRPVLVMAHALYGDDWLAQGRDAQIIARNNVRHPGFVPAGAPLSWVSA